MNIGSGRLLDVCGACVGVCVGMCVRMGRLWWVFRSVGL